MLQIFLLLLILPIVQTQNVVGFGVSWTPPTVLTLQMIIDFAIEEEWKHVVLFDCIGSNDCTRPYARLLFNCFFVNDIQLAIKPLTESTDLAKVFNVDSHKLGVVVLIDDINLDVEDNLLHKIMIQSKGMRAVVFGELTSWLLLSTKWNQAEIYDAIKDWPIGVDSDFTVAMSFLPADTILSVFDQFSNKTCESLRRYGYRYNYARLRRGQNISPPEVRFLQNTEDTSKTVMVFFIVRLYRIRIDGNASFIEEAWNTWNPSRRFTYKQRYLPKQREDLRQYSLNFGLDNSSRSLGDESAVNDMQSSERATSVDTLLELITLFEICLNVSANTTNYVYHEPLQASKENDDLIHGITNGEIDVGAAYFDTELDRNNMLWLSYPIVHFTRKIYFKPPDYSTNIFMQPFSTKLLLCVFMTLVLIIASMEAINYVTSYIHWKEDKAHLGIGEATLWCFSIMCAQGSPWTPRTRAGKTVLICSLMFALIIYNAYSGFITSILSVKIKSIKNESDFSDYGYSYGCSKSDYEYLASNGEMRNFYMKALEANQLKIPEKLGLERTLNGSYAFFISETVANRIFRNSLAFERCQVGVLPTKTKGTLALPLPENSPYKKIINLSLLRMWQYGMLHKLNMNIKPPLLNCEDIPTYNQASMKDVYGAFAILGTGAVTAVVIFICERAWLPMHLLGYDAKLRNALGHNPSISRLIEIRDRIFRKKWKKLSRGEQLQEIFRQQNNRLPYNP